MKKLLTLLSIFLSLGNWCTAQSTYKYDATQKYELNTIGTRNIDPLVALQDGDTKTSINPGYGKVMTDDQFWILTKGLIVDSIKLYSNTGSKSNSPFILNGWFNGKETQLASFSAGVYNNWITYKAAHISADKLHIISTLNQTTWPTEMILYSNSKPVVIKYAKAPKIYLSDEIGLNTFPWSFAKTDNSLNLISNVFKTFAGINGARIYSDWPLFESVQGINTFNPTHVGGWPYDVILDSLKSHGIVALFDLKLQTDWMAKTWPSVNAQNKPTMYGADPASPASYKEQSRMAFQLAARYGQTPVSNGLLTIDVTARWNGDAVNVKRSGIGSLLYIENNNENDRWWQTTTAYQTAWQCAANQSAFYDGDLGRLGMGYGVKTADPLMQVAVPGICNVNVDYIMGMVDWCNMNRAGKLSWDIINYHLYAGTNQPEGNIDVQLAPIAKMARQLNQPLWLTETGYDKQAGSPVAAPSEQIRAQWILRTVLLMPIIGISRTFIYQDYDDNPGNTTQYATSGIIGTLSGLYLQQVSSLMKGYWYVSSTSVDGLIREHFTDGTHKINVIWSATSTGKTISTTATKGTLYQCTPSVMTSIAMKNNKINIGELPVFVYVK